MKLLLRSLLLTSLCTISSWSVSSGTLVVTQSPDVSVMEGETVNITCCWTLGFGRMRVAWLKNQTNTNKTEISRLINQSQGLMPNETSNCLHLTFPNVTREDSGRYICKVTVEIPSLTVVNGNGTVITVTAKGNTMDNTTGAQAARVIYEVPHIDSEEEEMDKHSTSSSRGSSQWCQVPVYESFDYFERVQTKESG
uniref:junctional adhesion molecule A-like isoform X2 n=1 Tax=Epinephelus lanceolatus TaxID=310571 RepID=UPI001445E17C|nr:junctional adhesion molecule A-like isoform X2 [Epinephelus lanceolatus]